MGQKLKDANKEAVSITIHPMILQKIKSVALENERSVSWMINRVLAEKFGLINNEE